MLLCESMKLSVLFVLCAFSALAQFSPDEQMRFCSYTNAVGEFFQWRMSSPRYPAAGRKYPLIVFLHGSGECGTDNKRHIRIGLPRLLHTLRLLNHEAIVLAPQCQQGNWWVKRLAMSDDYRMDGSPTVAMEALIELIKHVTAEYPVDSDRVYITGLSLGGFGTWDAVQRYPNNFAAAVPICAGGDIHAVKSLKNLPVWVFHGDKDTNVSVECSRRMVAAMRAAGCRKLRYTEYPGVAHNCWDRAYSDKEMVTWMLQQTRYKKPPFWKFWAR
jgi:predicted peptidase